MFCFNFFSPFLLSLPLPSFFRTLPSAIQPFFFFLRQNENANRSPCSCFVFAFIYFFEVIFRDNNKKKHSVEEQHGESCSSQNIHPPKARVREGKRERFLVQHPRENFKAKSFLLSLHFLQHRRQPLRPVSYTQLRKTGVFTSALTGQSRVMLAREDPSTLPSHYPTNTDLPSRRQPRSPLGDAGCQMLENAAETGSDCRAKDIS